MEYFTRCWATLCTSYEAIIARPASKCLEVRGRRSLRTVENDLTSKITRVAEGVRARAAGVGREQQCGGEDCSLNLRRGKRDVGRHPLADTHGDAAGRVIAVIAVAGDRQRSILREGGGGI